MSEAIKNEICSIADLDISVPDLFTSENVLESFKRLREDDPVHYCADSQFGPYWSITRYEDIIKVDTNHQIFSSEASLGGIIIDDAVVRPPVEGADFKNFIAQDQPEHGPIRRAVQPIAAPDSLASFKDLIEQRTSDVLDSLPEGEVFDWVELVSVELTTQMLATLFHFPFEDRRKLTRWSDVVTSIEGAEHFPGHEQRVQELQECLTYFSRLRQERAADPKSFDLISMMAHNEATKDMDDMHYLGNVLLLIVGGNDTTRNSMSASINASNLFPEEFAKLRKDPGLIDKMVAEVIRWQTPLSHMRRTALQDFELGGKQIKKGDKVVMWYYSGNHDEEMFDNPREVRFDRENGNRHLSFGFGIHRCMGLRIGELQLRILWQQILKKFEKIELVEPPKRLKSNFVNGYTEMKVKITRVS